MYMKAKNSRRILSVLCVNMEHPTLKKSILRIDFRCIRCYNVWETGKALKRRVICERLPERDACAESVLSVITDEDHLGAAANQPGRHRYRHEWEACRTREKQATRVEPRSYVPWIFWDPWAFLFQRLYFSWRLKKKIIYERKIKTWKLHSKMVP